MSRSASLVITVVLLACACANNGTKAEPGQQSAYSAARERWAESRPAAYSYVLERGCLCPRELVGPVRIEVRGDSVLSRTYTADGTPVKAENAHLFGAMESVFELIARALESAYAVTAAYDTSYGYPTSAGIDYRKELIDDESGIKVTEFRALGQ